MISESKNLPFFTPIEYETPSSEKEKLRESVDDYFYLSGKKAVVLSGGKAVKIQEVAQSSFRRYVLGALKILSYCTVIVPLVMLGLKTMLRCEEQFRIQVAPRPAVVPSPLKKERFATFVFGDIHGELDGFLEDLDKAQVIDKTMKAWIGKKATVVQMGDVIDRGPKSEESYEYLEKLQKEAKSAGGHVIRLLGNHELMALEGDLNYAEAANFSNLPKFIEKMKKDIASGKVQAAYTDGVRLYIHGGLRSGVRTQLEKEIRKGQKKQVGAEISLQELVNHINNIVKTAVQKNDFSHAIFGVSRIRGGEALVGGIFWTDRSELMESMNARDIPQVAGHTVPQPNEELIRKTDSMRLVVVDAGMADCYGGQRAFMKIEGGQISTIQKVWDTWHTEVRPDPLEISRN